MAQKIINTKIREAYDTEANWIKHNPVLLAGQLAYSSDKYGKYKIGDGVAKWSQLQYMTLGWNDITEKPSTFSPSTHTHPVSQVTGLTPSAIGAAPDNHNHDTIYASHSHSHSSIHDCNSGSSIGISSTLGIVPSVSEKYDIVVTNTSEHGNKFVTLDKTIFANYLIDTIPLKAITNTQIDSLASL